MVKRFANYQYVFGDMSDRDKQEKGSKFWNEGKFENFVLPFLPEDCTDMTFVDMGCNHGIFLKMAEDMGFRKVVGIDYDRRVLEKALQWKEMNGGKYEVRRGLLEHSLPELPIADYTVLANSHYYVSIDRWLDYVRNLKNKTRYCIIVTAKKSRKPDSKASPDIDKIRWYFKDWEEVGYEEPPLEGDPYPRRLYSICFKNPLLERVPLEDLDCGNNVQEGFYKEIDEGKDPTETEYYKILKPYRKGWSEVKLNKYVHDKKNIYTDLKEYGIKKPLIVKTSRNNRIVDGNHRYNMLRYLGHKSAIIRRII